MPTPARPTSIGRRSSAPRRIDKERYFRWRKYWDYSGGIATDLFYHQLSHLQIALGPEFPSRVMAGGGIYVQNDREVPDTYSTIIEYPTLHSVVLCSSMANRQSVQEMIRGHEATMYFEAPGVVVRPEKEFEEARKEIQVATEPRPDHWVNFLECVRTRNQPHLNAEVGYKIMTAIQLGVLAFRTGKIMSFDPAKEETI
jgi:predicted dehydrogenase